MPRRQSRTCKKSCGSRQTLVQDSDSSSRGSLSSPRESERSSQSGNPASENGPGMMLGSAVAVLDRMTTAQLAELDSAPLHKQLKPAKSPRVKLVTKKDKSIDIFGFSCNKGALTIIVALLVGSFGLYTQNVNLRTMIQENVVIHPFIQRMPELNFAQRFYEGMPSMPQNLSNLKLSDLGQSFNFNLSLSSISLPAQISFQSLRSVMKTPRPGLELKKAGFKPKHPVIIIPGFVTSGLELWEALPCAQQQLRERIWGSWGMTTSFLWARQCWLDHLRLDEVTGLDPRGVKVRASQGLEAVDYFVAGYHVWAKMIEAFADLGYDPNNLITESYDWRLALPNMEKRDGYFTRLKARIEVVTKLSEEKAFVVSHSWGDNVFRQFMTWVSAHDSLWVEQHVASYANLAGPTLGVPKTISSYLSGETRDTVEMGYVTALLANAHFTRGHRTRLFRSWGAGMGMLPVGGPPIWGNSSWAPDDDPQLHGPASYGSMVSIWETGDESVEALDKNKTLLDSFKLTSANKASNRSSVVDLDVDKAIQLLLDEGGPVFCRNARRWSGISSNVRSKSCERDPMVDNRHLSSLETPLPKAPSLQMFCLYGVGIPTERSYQYQHLQTKKAFEAAKKAESDEDDPTELDVSYKLYTDVHDLRTNLDHGVRLSDGDGTVPLISLGTMCRKYWQDPSLNPSGIRVVTREFEHQPLYLPNASSINPFYHYQKLRNFMRGGPRSADHVDILSHEDVLKDALLIASGHASTLSDRILSNIDSIVANISSDASQCQGE